MIRITFKTGASSFFLRRCPKHAHVLGRDCEIGDFVWQHKAEVYLLFLHILTICKISCSGDISSLPCCGCTVIWIFNISNMIHCLQENCYRSILFAFSNLCGNTNRSWSLEPSFCESLIILNIWNAALRVWKMLCVLCKRTVPSKSQGFQANGCLNQVSYACTYTL